MNRFNVGDMVRIAKSSEYYGIGLTWVPEDTDGKVISASRSGSVEVDWGDDISSYYWEHDLKLRKKAVST